MARAKVYQWAEVAEAAVRDGVGKKEIVGGEGAMTLITIRAGTVADRHSHPHEQFIHVLSGRGRLATDDDACELGPGTVVHLPADTFHSAVFDDETVLLEINILPAQGHA